MKKDRGGTERAGQEKGEERAEKGDGVRAAFFDGRAFAAALTMPAFFSAHLHSSRCSSLKPKSPMNDATSFSKASASTTRFPQKLVNLMVTTTGRVIPS